MLETVALHIFFLSRRNTEKGRVFLFSYFPQPIVKVFLPPPPKQQISNPLSSDLLCFSFFFNLVCPKQRGQGEPIKSYWALQQRKTSPPVSKKQQLQMHLFGVSLEYKFLFSCELERHKLKFCCFPSWMDQASVQRIRTRPIDPSTHQ